MATRRGLFFEGAAWHAQADVIYDEGTHGHHVPTNQLPQMETIKIERPPGPQQAPCVKLVSINVYGCTQTV
eukprot:2320601-Pyramimonas_sp.AAC.1